MASATKNTKKSTGDVKSLSSQLKGVAAAAKSLGIDTRKADAMVKQTERQGSKSFAGSREEKAYIADVKANPMPITNGTPTAPVPLPSTPAVQPLPTGTSPTDLSTYYGLATNTATDTTGTAPTGTTGTPATDPFLQAIFENTPPDGAKELRRLERDFELSQRQADVTNLKGQLGAITSQAQADKLKLEDQGRGIPEPIILGQQARIDREAAIRALPIAAQLDVAQGDLEMAQQRIDRLFQVRMADAQAQYNFKSKVIDSIANYVDKQETKRLEEVRWQQQLNLKKEERNFSLMSDWAKMAFENGQSTLGGKIMALDTNSPTFQTEFARLQGQVVKPMGAGTQDWDIQGDWKINKRTGEVVPLTAPTGTQGTTNLEEKYTSLLNDIGKARELKGAVGAGWIERNIKSAFVGSNEPAQLENITNTIKANLLTLNTDPAIKKFFGPQMSNRDTELMMGAAGTLDPVRQTPAEYEKDLQDAANLIVRAREAVRQGVATQTSYSQPTVVAPDGMEIVIID